MWKIFEFCDEYCWKCDWKCENCFECSCRCVSIIFTILWSVFAILVAVLISISIGVVDLNKFALKFDTVNFVLDNNTIYLPGRYYHSLGTKLILYPSTWTMITFLNETSNMIAVTSLDSANIFIEAKLMYRIRTEFSHLLYINFPNGDYTKFYSDIVANAIQNTAQNYSINDFLNIRRNISQIFANKVNFAFRNNYAELMSFQLGQIIFDEIYEQFILQQATTKNQMGVYILNGQLSLFNASINLLRSQTDLNIFKLTSLANQNASTTINNANVNGDLNITLSQADALKIFVSVNGLNFTSQELIKFLLYDKLNDLSSFNSSSNNFSFGSGGAYINYK